MLKRRSILGVISGLCGTAAVGGTASSSALSELALRGTFDIASAKLHSGNPDDQGAVLTRLVARAVKERKPLFLPPGRYVVSNLDLPDGAHLIGVPGASRLVFAGAGHFLRARNATRIRMEGLTLDGANRSLGGGSSALAEFHGIAGLEILDCDILGATGTALHLVRCGGRLEHNRISGAAGSAIYAVESTPLAIRDNEIADCMNGGILVHRWSAAEDGTLVTGNRVARIAAADGGTGQNGNGINIFRANGVIVANNHVSQCAFSAIRANSASNVQIVSNQCLESGETALFSEFSFQGSVVANNVIDGGANGISITNFNDGGRLATVTGNVVRNIVGKGPYDEPLDSFGSGIAVEADTVVASNTIEHVSKWGMLIGWGPFLRNVSATGNIVRDVPVGVAVSVVEEAREALIKDNIIEGTPGGAVVGFRWGEPATSDLTVSHSNHAHLTVVGNRTS